MVNPKVLRRPAQTAINDAYPDAALRAEVSGKTAVTCRVRLDTTLADCVVSSEEPTGYGFGEASLELVKGYRITPGTVDGVPRDDSKVSIPINWRLEGPEPGRRATALWVPILFALSTLLALALSFLPPRQRPR